MHTIPYNDTGTEAYSITLHRSLFDSMLILSSWLSWWADTGQQPNTHTAARSLPSHMGQGENTVQQQPKRWCVINTFLTTNPNHSTIWAAVKKVNSVPDRSSTTGFL